ncbi:hypothetical protein ZWY2020_005520 [Hordeum vulgare]|nr:hypothetical protein ZWY2020_005520 [Hordeum vulgare]
MVGSSWRSGARWRRGAAFRRGRDNRRSGMDGSLRFPAESGGSLRSVELELAGARPWLHGAAPEEKRKRDGAVRRRRGRESKGRRGRGQRGVCGSGGDLRSWVSISLLIVGEAAHGGDSLWAPTPPSSVQVRRRALGDTRNTITEHNDGCERVPCCC